MLRIQNLNKNFDGTCAVSDFSLDLQPEKITSIIGPNGAGKSTLFNIATGFLKQDSGTILFNDTSLDGFPAWKRTQRGLSRTFQNLRLLKKLSVLDNVLIARQHQRGEKLFNSLFLFSENSSEHKRNIEKSLSYLEFVGLIDKKNELAENLSYGQQKLLTLACCIAAESSLLLLDEPVAGVQPATIGKICSLLEELVRKQQKTVLLIEHNIDVVSEISDLIVVMDEGRKIAEDKPAMIKINPEILEAYLS